MTNTDVTKIMKRIDALEKSLNSLEDLAWWTILAGQRGFKVGQRVRLTDRAIRKGITTKGGARKGTIKKIGETFSVIVLMDGYKQPHSYHHSFFEEVWRPQTER